jgi:hypothetical protein
MTGEGVSDIERASVIAAKCREEVMALFIQVLCDSSR